ncbi:hypothetical protein NXS19_005232 [Fusarium pseudograminearum]|nr:hypothetical protein NXS19_005232 [Fusarium pseudograminearum]
MMEAETNRQLWGFSHLISKQPDNLKVLSEMALTSLLISFYTLERQSSQVYLLPRRQGSSWLRTYAQCSRRPLYPGACKVTALIPSGQYVQQVRPAPTFLPTFPCPRLSKPMSAPLLFLLLLQRKLPPTLLRHIPPHCYGISPCHTHSVSAHSRYACLPTPSSIRTLYLLVPVVAAVAGCSPTQLPRSWSPLHYVQFSRSHLLLT